MSNKRKYLKSLLDQLETLAIQTQYNFARGTDFYDAYVDRLQKKREQILAYIERRS